MLVAIRNTIGHLELGKLLDGLAGAGKDTENVEADLQRHVRTEGYAGGGKERQGRDERKKKKKGRRTVLLSGLHWPTVTWSPSSTRKAGETCAARFLWRFS